MMHLYARPRTRRKTEVCNRPVFNEGTYKTNETQWLAMGGYYDHSPVPRTCILLVMIILGSLAGSVCCCDVNKCTEGYRIALDSLNHQRHKNNIDIQCTALRTYVQCLNSLRDCKGVIQFHGFKKGAKNLMTKHSCSKNGPTYTVNDSDVALPPDDICTFHGKKAYRHCGLFGDPHIRTFNNDFQTCRVQGAWPLVINDHLTVQVTNEPVSSSIGATATSRLTVIINKNRDCVSDHYLMYQASSSLLPSTFADGQTTYGKSRSVELIEVDPGKHIEINIKYIDTKILIRQVGSYLTFAITIPEEYLNSSEPVQLCVSGCSEGQRINYQEFLALRKKQISSEVNLMSRNDAEKLCRSAQLVDFYFDSCVFDMITTGNENFTLAAYTAMQDLLRLAPEIGKTQENRTSLDKYDVLYGSSSSVRTTRLDLLRILVLTVIICFFTVQART